MKILLVSAQALFRETRFGGAKRLYYLAKALESGNELHVVCLDMCEEIPQGELPRHDFEQALFLPLERTLPLTARGAFLSPLARSVTNNRAALSQFLSGISFDATLFAFPGSLHVLMQGFPRHSGRCFYLEDDLLLPQIEAQARSGKNPFLRIVKAVRYRQGRAFFNAALRRMSGFIGISEQEERIVNTLWPQLPSTLLGYGIPLAEYPLLDPAEGPLVLGFIGNYRHLPNRDAAVWMIETLFPAVQKRFPEARLVLCGAGFPDALRVACAGNSGIEVRGEVDSLPEFYQSITVFLNALRQGRGLRTKLIETAAFGRPIVSTPLGAEGLESFRMGFFDNPEELVGLLEDLGVPGRATESVRLNRAEVERNYSTEAVGQRLLEILTPSRSAANSTDS